MHSAKDTENANARQTSHLITRTKPTSATTTPNKATSTITTQAKTVLTNAKPDASASAERKHTTLGEIAGLPNQNQGEQPRSRRVAKDKSFVRLQLVRIRCMFIAAKCQSPYFNFALFALLTSLLIKYLHSHPLYTFATSLSSPA